MFAVLMSVSGGATTNSLWFARAWQIEDGLPEHTIVGLEQTSDGFLWIATHRSLSRFDGVRFQEFSPVTPAGPRAEQIRAMLLDRSGRLWLAKDGGIIICITDGSITSSNLFPEAVSGAQIRSIVEDGQSNLWLADSAGTVYQFQNGQTRVFGVAEGLPGRGPCWIATDAKGQLWFSQAGRLGVFRDGRFLKLFTLGQQSSRITTARRGGIWVFADSKLHHCQEEIGITAIDELPLESNVSDVTVNALFEDRAGGVWVGTSSDGLFRFGAQGFERVAVSHPSIINVFEDAEGNIWVGTRGGGLNRLSPRALRLVGAAAGLPFAAAQSACEDSAGVLWVVGQNGALAARSNGVWRLVSSEQTWTGGDAACVLAEPDGSVLIGTRDRGLFRHENGHIEPVSWNQQLTNLFIRSLYASTNDELWIALNGFVARYRIADGTLKHFSLPSGVSDVRAMIQDANGDLWMGTTSDGYLFRISGDRFIDETINVMGEARHIRCLQITRDGSLWFGFAGQGLGRLKGGQFFQFRTDHGLWDQFISQILPDDEGRLWIAGNRGVFLVTQNELESVALGRQTRIKSVVFGRGDGVANLQATFGVCPAATRTQDGKLLLPMWTGLVIVEPHLLQKSPKAPPVVIERISVNGQLAAAYDSQQPNEAAGNVKPVNLRHSPAHLRLEPGVNRLEIEFTGLSLTSPENVTFRYQLEGIDQEWVEAGLARVARYPRVPPGKYRFRVTASNHDGIWNETGMTVRLEVKPFFWETTWFRVTAALATVGLLGGSVLLTLRRRYRRKLEVLQQQQALERERSRIAQDLHDDLGAGLVEINFSSELAQDPELTPEEVREHTREIGIRAREMVTALDEIVWAVNPKHDSVSSLATYFCQFAQHFLKATSVRCHLDVARDLPAAPLNAEQRHSLFLAFKEALSNVVQHSGATDLRLAIAATNGTLTITISDNGRGFSTSTPFEKNGADGLENMQRRLHQLGGRCELKTKPEKGTTVRFNVPLSQVSAMPPDNPIEVL